MSLSVVQTQMLETNNRQHHPKVLPTTCSFHSRCQSCMYSIHVMNGISGNYCLIDFIHAVGL